MDEKIKKLILGSLLHDIGKVVQRSKKNGNSHKHSIWGAEYLTENKIIEDVEILNQIKYHHSEELKHANLSTNSLAYITYCADNIAAATERRERDEDNRGWWFRRFTPLYTVFNSMYGSDERYGYSGAPLFEDGKIPYPMKKKEVYNYDYYASILLKIESALKQTAGDWVYFNVLLSTLENYWTFIPDSTNVTQLVDISLYDHSKMTAAFACCMYQYAKSIEDENYQNLFQKNASKFYNVDAFTILTLDLSGIQKFIYTIHSDGALKTLRARSFYLEILMEYIVDELLEKIGLTRINVLYIGGGSANLLLPNVETTIIGVNKITAEVNKWLVMEYKTALYLGSAFQTCSANDLNSKDIANKTDYGFINNMIKTDLSEENLHRYSANMIRRMNPKEYSVQGIEHSSSDGRECKVCHRIDHLITKSEYFNCFKDDLKDEEDNVLCKVCMAMLLNSRDIMNHEQNFDLIESKRKNKDIFYVLDTDTVVDDRLLLPLPNGKKLFMTTENDVIDKSYHIYNKNRIITLKDSGNCIWVADYIKGETFEELAKKATGIEKIGVIRADVDELGRAFSEGFERNKGPRYNRNTISRKATFSRMISLFFKYHMRNILENGETYLADKPINNRRNAAVIYSGGDDLFIVGSWDDIIGFAVDLYNHFEKFTQHKLTLSAGVGIYAPKYPISVIAKETEELEENSKMNQGKNSITIFDKAFTFHWDCFINKVLGEKYKLIKEFFDTCGEQGNTFLHHLLELLNNIEDKPINLARYAFFISKLEPGGNQKTEEKNSYINFKETMYKWMSKAESYDEKENDENDVKQCILAIYLYLYMRREKKDGK